MNLPTNSSLSVTLSQQNLRAHTTASCSPSYAAGDTLILNRKPHDITASPRTLACLESLRTLRASLENSDASLPKLSTYPLRIVSENNFPTAAGLASSAAGFAALVAAIAQLYQLPHSNSELSRIARQGSGSACRSMLGGYVAWRMGSERGGEDSLAEQVAPMSHWPDMRALVLVVSDSKKDVPSTSGMQATVHSPLFASRARDVVPRHMLRIERAIADRDFAAFADVTMKDSNNFHATCLDTWPPIFYMNDTSRAAIRLVHELNSAAGRTVAAYTFDAGPNAVIYYLEKDASLVLGTFKTILRSAQGWEATAEIDVPVDTTILDKLDERAIAALSQGVNRVIPTAVGDGPLSTEEHLISENGETL